MHYTLHQLQVFLKVNQTESITKAAEELHLSQPAVSIQLKNFQDQFDIPLTEVIGRKLYITDFGKEIAQAAERIIDEVHAINYKTQSYKGQLSGRLKVSVVSTGKYVMPYFLTDFIKRNQSIELNLDVTNKAGVIQSLENNEVDFALVSVLPDNLSVEKVELMSNDLYLVGNKDSELTEKEYEENLLEQIALIYREQGSGTRLVMERYMDSHKLKLHKKMELTSNEAVKQAVIAGLGYSIMPLIGIRNELQNGILKIIPIKGLPIVSNWYLIYMRQKNFSPVAAAYLDFIKKQKENIIQTHFSSPFA
jgi:LysR family transcriptional regulator, low CO2-responsive transcriptional regulator